MTGRDTMHFRRLAFSLVALAALLTYLPAFNNGFIFDDFVYLSQIRIVRQHPGEILHVSPGFSRLTGHLYFLICSLAFGTDSAGYYSVSLLLHIVNACLVFSLVFGLTGDAFAALVSALCFTVYERHREAVFWISAVHELLLGLSALLCLRFWRSYLERGRASHYGGALLAFGAALLSKESALALVPLMLALERFTNTDRPRGRLEQALAYASFATLATAYAMVVHLSHPLIAHGFYARTTHFFLVYGRTIATLGLFVCAGLVAARFLSGSPELLQHLFRNNAWRFFLAWLLLTPVPYCFATYVDQIPSRQTYLPSVATAALLGLLARAVKPHLNTARAKVTGALLLGLLFLGNMGYVWLQDVQFVRRAEPTRLLIENLQRTPPPSAGPARVYIVCDSQYFKSVFRAAIEEFSPPGRWKVVFLSSPAENSIRLDAGELLFAWDDKQQALRRIAGLAPSPR